ncbi:E3 ubiquitin-protein ligase HECTD3-like [Pecten maximus]|uniref:E3 ubiquitin-protein ligase HECTD3-like n=1 Tax=Pecten maximus TaxID=6579 RepID=UPI001458090F|nr:E3 ubiquitin-protein ligase HECTD3-like [Pecten maximus]
MTNNNSAWNSRRRLARIRCLFESIRCFSEGKPLPECLCYIPAEVEYQTQHRSVVKLYQDVQKSSKKVGEIVLTSESRLVVSGEEYCNSQGKWLKVRKFKSCPSSDYVTYDSDAWVLQYSSKSATDDPALQIIPCNSLNKNRKRSDSWEDAVEQHFAGQFLTRRVQLADCDKSAMSRLMEIPAGWTLEGDEELVRLMSQHIPPDNDHLGSIKSFVESVDVSSCCDDEAGPSCLTDADPDTYWESDGSQGNHWILLKMKKGTVILKLQLTLDGSDDNYLPARVTVQGGEQENLSVLRSLAIDWEVKDVEDVTILENMTEHYPIIMILIKECKAGGIDTRIRGIKISSSEGRYLGFDRDFFKGENLVRYPKLEPYPPDQLYRRSLLLQRLMVILDSVLPYIVPAWEYSIGSYNSLELVRQLLPLSKKRLNLIETFIKESSSERPAEIPKLFINRRAAMEHRCNVTQDSDFRNTIFMQIYEGLKPRDRTAKPLNYRWTSRYEQWWECKFMSEGVIDQGGGFRDSLSDLAEELCPMAADKPLPLPFFIRAPNQLRDDSNVNKDVYIPNPAFKEFAKYEWVGQLMGACLRGKENLILAFPSFVWKRLAGETVSWSRNFNTVDAAEVTLIDNMEAIDKEKFLILGRTWSTVLSDGTAVLMKVDDKGNPLDLMYEDRKEYCDKVRKIRMAESDEQLEAIRKGLLKVVPQAVLDLMTWQELEHRVSGDPEITMDDLKRSIRYDDVEETDTRVKYMWEALKSFSNEDRSRFLRFVTGRRRLPAPVHISSGKGDSVDCLPESSTCANTLYLPNYTSAKTAEEKLRYASYNCMDMDADVNPWDE